MNLTKRSKILVAITGLIAILAVVAQATGVLAAWNDKVWGSSSFGRGSVVEGYARSVTAHSVTNRIITDGAFTATNVTRTHTSPGSGTDGWRRDSSLGLLGLGIVAASGRSEASYTTSGAQITASSRSQARNITLAPTGLASVLSTPLLTEYEAGVSCTSSNNGRAVTPSVTVPPKGPDFRIGLVGSYSIPPPNTSIPVSGYGAGFQLTGTMTSTATTTSKSALSTLVLDAAIKDLVGLTTWYVTVQFVRAECGIGEPLPSAVTGSGQAARAAGARSSESTTPSESSESSSSAAKSESAESSDEKSSSSSSVERESTSSDSSDSSEAAASSSPSGDPQSSSSASSPDSPGDKADDGLEQQGPTAPTNVAIGSSFPVIATDGTKLGTAAIRNVESDAPAAGAPTNVAVQMTITTSAEGGHLSSVSWDDFIPMLGGVPQSAGAGSAAVAPLLPARLAAGETYTGWVVFTAPSAANAAMFKPSGTAGWVFSLPEPTIPVTSTTKPVPMAEAPEESETAAPDADDATTAPGTTEATPVPEEADSAPPTTSSSSGTAAE